MNLSVRVRRCSGCEREFATEHQFPLLWRSRRCGGCGTPLDQPKIVLRNPVGLVSTGTSGASSLVRSQAWGPSGAFRVEFPDEHVRRITRSRDRDGSLFGHWLRVAKDVEYVLTLTYNRKDYDVVSTFPSGEDSVASLLRSCSGLVVCVHAPDASSLGDEASAEALDQRLSSWIHGLLAHKHHRVRRIGFAVTAIDLLSAVASVAHSIASSWFLSSLGFTIGIATGLGLQFDVFPTSAYGFPRNKDDNGARYPSARAYNVHEPFRFAIAGAASHADAGQRKSDAGSSTDRPDLATTRPRFDVALSFAGEDRQFVEAVAGELRRFGVRVFYDHYEGVALWGKNLIDVLGDVYSQQSTYIAVFVSSAYLCKTWTRFERQVAQAHRMDSGFEGILPIRLENVEVPGILGTVAYIDATKLKPVELAKMICSKVRHQSGAG